MNSGDVFSIILALLGTVGVMVLTYYGSRWYISRFVANQNSLSSGNHLKVVERLIVGKSGSIIILDVKGKQYLVGISEQSIQVLSEIEDPIPLQKKQEISKESFLSMVKTFTQKEK